MLLLLNYIASFNKDIEISNTLETIWLSENIPFIIKSSMYLPQADVFFFCFVLLLKPLLNSSIKTTVIILPWQLPNIIHTLIIKNELLKKEFITFIQFQLSYISLKTINKTDNICYSCFW